VTLCGFVTSNAEVEVDEMRVQTAKKLFKSVKSTFNELIVGHLIELSLKRLKREDDH